MNTELSRRAEDIFFDLLDLEGDARRRALDEACREEPGLRSEVQSLLANHLRAEGFLETGRLRDEVAADGGILAPGVRVAGYTVLGVLGSGGMGVVYVAEQQRPRRTVALKLIRRAGGGGGGAMARRFELEAEVLGRLQHPGIAQIFEAGAAEMDGRAQPFIAMELVNGAPLTKYASDRALGLREKLALVARVCEAVEHAHQRGVIHRDLKPANILVGEDGRPRVLDFGVARAVGDDGHGITAHTDIGQMIGTLAYMSPEQVRADPAEVDTRSDVYALGVVLFELLTGRAPHDLKTRPLPEASRVICEEEAPRLGTIDRTLRGDLETITAKALDKDKNRRYRSAADLGEDLHRYLDGRPIAARDDSALYVLRKRLRRYRGTVAVGAVSVITLGGVAGYALRESVRNQHLAQSESEAKTKALNALTAAGLARARADETAAKLRVELASSNVERGRLFGRTGNLAAAEDLIWPEHLRNPSSPQTHWALWELYSHETCVATIPAHRGSIARLAMGPDGRLYSAGEDREIQVRDPGATRVLRTLKGHTGAITDLRMSGDGQLLASSSLDGTVRIWKPDSEELPRVINAFSDGVRCIALSPDAGRIAVAGFKGVGIWETGTGTPLATMPGSLEQPGTAMTWSPDGQWIAIGAQWPDFAARLWTGEANHTPERLVGHTGAISSMAFSPDSTTLVTGANDREIRFWDLATRRTVRKLLAPNGTIRALQFARDGQSLMSSGWWTIDVWDVAKGERARSFSLREGANHGVISPDGRIVAAVFGDGAMRLWDLTADPGLVRLPGQRGRTTITLSPDGRIAATGDGEGDVRLWEGSTGRLLAKFAGHRGRVRALKFSPDGASLATSGDDTALRLWDMRSGAKIAQVAGYASISGDSIAFDGSGTRLLAAGLDTCVRILDAHDLHETARLPAMGFEVVSSRFSPDGSMAVVISRDHKVHMFALSGGESFELETPANTTDWTAAFSSDGRQLLVGDWLKTVQLWDLPSRTLVTTMRGHSGLVTQVEFYPGMPSMAVSSAADGTVRLWDLGTHLGLATLDAFGGWDAISVALSPDGRRLAASSGTGDAAVWDMQYFDRHIAGNVEYQVNRLAGELGSDARSDELRAWADAALAATQKPWTPAPGAPGVDPDVVAAWGAPRAAAPGSSAAQK